MEDLESKIGQILSDPDAISNLMSMAKSLGLTPPDRSRDAEPTAASEPQSDASTPEPAEASLLGNLPFSVMELLSEAGKVDTKQAALFNALKPFLKPGRREKIDKAMRIARLSHVAGFALKNWEHE